MRLTMWLFLALTACSGSTVKLDDTSTSDTSDADTDTDSDTDADTDTDTDTDTNTCLSGEYWTDRNRGSSKMHPGYACIDCHEGEREAPDFEVAGTVYAAEHQEDDCNGEDNVTVEITDANGDVYTDDTNSAGNFYIESRDARIALPYTARILVNGEEVAVMDGEQDNGDCNSCHTMEGREDAPGRISIN